MDDSSPDSCSLGVRAMYGLLENGRTDGFETRSHGQSEIESKQSKIRIWDQNQSGIWVRLQGLSSCVKHFMKSPLSKNCRYTQLTS
jgi:hypothetical protein